MSTSPAACPDTKPAPAPTACMLHADFHVMEPECWAVTVDWYAAHTHLTAAEQRDDYQAAVERKMLDHLARGRLNRG